MELTTFRLSTEHENDENKRESIWTFPHRWRFRFFVIFYSLVIGTTAWGTYETIVEISPNGLDYRSFIVVYVQSIAGSVVTSMLLIDFMRSLKMLSNAIEDWLIQKRKKREAEWRAREEEWRAREEEIQAREEEWRAREERLRAEAFEYGRLVAAYEAKGEEPPPPPWDTNSN